MTYKRILIINPFGIGDVLFTTPLIQNIKSSQPDVFIGYLANRRTAVFLQDHPQIDRVFVYERDEYVDIYRRSKIQFFKKMISQLAEIRAAKFDCLIDLSLNGSASFLMAFAGIPQRLGFNYKNRSLFLTRKIPLRGFEGRHVAEYYLSLARELGFKTESHEINFPIKETDRQWAEHFLQSLALPSGQPIIAVVPGGGASWGKDAEYKRWPVERFAELADKLIEKSSAVIILLGDKQEEELCKTMAQAMRAQPVMVCGQTTLGQLAALLKKCSLAVVNDGGPLHIAVAAGVKTVSIFGPVDEKVYGPYPAAGHTVVSHSIACRPCYRQFRRASCEHISCLKNITTEEVYRKIENILSADLKTVR